MAEQEHNMTTQYNPTQSQAVVYTIPNDYFCETAIRILRLRGIPRDKVVEKSIERHKEEFDAACPGAKFVPQIFIDGTLIGGTSDMVKWFKERSIPDGVK
jgi:glutaredoxin